jgi:Holliday junction DNA helicase RuvB
MSEVIDAFKSIIGNDDIKKQLLVSLSAAKYKNLPVPHVLFAGAAGCGKTSMSKAVAKAMNVPYIAVSPYGLRTEKAIKEEIVDRLPWNGYNRKGEKIGKIFPSIVFIDEIHNLPLRGQEILGIMMESWEFVLPRNKGNLHIPQFTLIGATTMEGMLSKPMRDRFKIIHRFNTYSLKDSIDITTNYVANIKKLKINEEAALEIAKRGRGVPRLIIRYIDWISDMALLEMPCPKEEVRTEMIKAIKFPEESSLIITVEEVRKAFIIMKIDDQGLNEVDVKILKCLSESETPVGIDTLVVISNETAKTIEHVIEPYLIQIGFIKRTPSGRILTETGRQYLEDRNLISANRFYFSLEPTGESNA